MDIYIIIGLGNYGHVLAEELSALGHEVIGADISAGRVVAQDKYITKGGNEMIAPRFTYHGYRFIEIDRKSVV